MAAERVGTVSREHLDRMIRDLRHRGAGLSGSGIESLPRDAEHFALSYAQERLWLVARLHDNPPAYNVPGIVSARGPLDVAILMASVAALAERHEGLRTVFGAEEGEPWQAPGGAPTPFSIADLSRLDAAERERETRRWAAAEGRRRFDLERGPLSRVLLFQLGAENHRIMVTWHHLVADGWSLRVWLRELLAVYSSAAGGEPPVLPDLAIQPIDHAAWQRRRFEEGAWEEQLDYWLGELADAPALTPLPTDRPRPAERRLLGARVGEMISNDLAARLAALASQRGATLFALLTTALGVLLARHGAGEEVTIGSPVAGRGRSELEGLVGCFVNTVVLRPRLAGDPAFSEALEATREGVFQAFAHQDLPFEKLVEALQPERSSSFSPLFQVMIAHEEEGWAAPATVPLELEVEEGENGGAKFDLSLYSRLDGDVLETVWEYDTDLFDRTSVCRLAGRFERLLAAIADRPEARLSELALLSPTEDHQLRLEWSAVGPLALGEGETLWGRVATQAERTPEATAVAGAGLQLSYDELVRRAERLAGRLRALGVGAETPVAVCAERSPSLVVALSGVLAAGGAYVPLDPEYPAERIAYLLRDSGARWVLTEPAFAEALGDSAEVLLIEDAIAAGGDRATLPVPSSPISSGDAVAYWIYTSGSTGRPKGVGIRQRSAAARLEWAGRTMAADLETTLASTSICFDLSVFELFAPLSCGGRVELVADALALASAPGRGRVTLVNTVPSAMAELVRLGALEPSVRAVCLAGEALRRELVEAVYAASWVERVWNLYGPSEDTTYSTGGVVPRGAAVEPSIGRPLRGSRAHVAAARLLRLPSGCPGELLLAGAGLSRGYLGRPGVTAERFVPDPWSETPGSRLYRTGDRVRHRHGGELEFLGRFDHQVKVRGFRIEPGEIEAFLESLERVDEAAVLSAEGPGGLPRLVAFVASARRPAPAELRGAALRAFPEHMVPAAFVVLRELPRTPNGKLDRRALRMKAVETRPAEGGAAPSGPTEELVAGVWAEVLELPRVAADIGFFELGGHSLLATRVAARLGRLFGVEVSPGTLFQAQTVAELARRIDALRRSEQKPLPPVEPAPPGSEKPLSFAQERLWFLAQLDPGDPAYHVPVALRLTGRLEVAALGAALAGVSGRHEVLRARFESAAGRPRQRIAAEASSGLPMADLSRLGAGEAELERLARADARRPFDLELGPLSRALLVRRGGEEHTLLLNFHHAVIDGWSMGVLIRELAELYGAALALRPPALAEPRLQYADWAAWQRRWLTAERREAQLDYWRGRLEGFSGVLELPLDRPRPPVRRGRGGRVLRSLPAALRQRLESWSRPRGVTFFMTLAAAFQALLSRLAGQGDVAIGTPVAHRQSPELEELVGFFTNTLVLRTRLGDDPSFETLAERVREAALGAFEHQDLPFELLVDACQPERDLSRTPLFQALFAFQNAPLELELPGLELERLEIETGIAKFDLTLVVEDDPEAPVWLDYDSDLFDRTTAERLLRSYERFLAAIATSIATRPGRISELPLLSPPERAQTIWEWNATETPFETGLGIDELFERQARELPDALALSFEDSRGEDIHLSYAELGRRSRRLARFLRGLGVGPGDCVGISLERSAELVVALLGTLGAGATYVPLESDWPAERKFWVLSSLAVPCLLADGGQSRAIHDLRWRLPELNHVVFLDAVGPELEPEKIDEEAVRSLWNHVAERAVDRETAAGFVRGGSGEVFSAAEVDEYRDRVVALTEPWVSPEARVLEIGCGSGLILFELAPRVARYVGVDPSERTQETNRGEVARRGLEGVELVTGFAHEMSAVEGEFDLVLLASTVQFFPGPAYLARVLGAAFERLAPGGAVVVADVLDPERQAALWASLGESSRREELCLEAAVFHDLATGWPGGASVSVHERQEGFDNELGARYDVVLCKPLPGEGGSAEAPTRRLIRPWTAWHVGREPAEPLEPRGRGLAYVIFTSGSTGRPKGVMVRHEPVLNLVEWVNRSGGVGPGDRLLFVTSPCFDLSVYDVFGTLAAGGSIRVASRAELDEPRRLVERLENDAITIWDSAPAALERLVPLFPARAPSARLRRVLLSGDWIPVPLPDTIRSVFPRAEVVAMGGATEAVVWSNVYRVGEVDPRWPSIPYGRPIANAHYHVLDPRLGAVPIGVAGDLLIGGLCLAAGYAGSPGLTAERFVPDPFARQIGSRLYRTGDRARFLADGTIEFLGRLDTQVKVRGFRIELGEIESVLAAHPGVRRALALVRDDLPGGRALVAYALPDEGSELETSELRSHLHSHLPEPMVPPHLVVLESLPLTPNGKVDRGALPAPESVADGARRAPRGEIELAVHGIFSELLGLDDFGAEASFFELGGHSLLATRLVARLRDALGAELEVREIFEHPTVAGLAERVAAAEGRAGIPVPASFRRVEGFAGGIPLSWAQARLWFLDQLTPGNSAYNLPFFVALEGELDRSALRSAFAALLGRHEILRTTFEAGPVQVIAAEIETPFAEVDLERLGPADRGFESQRLAAGEAARGFDLERGPLVRALLVRWAPGEHRFFLTLHHVAADGWSRSILNRDLAALYEAALTGRAAVLPALPIQYADYALWQRQVQEGETAARSLEHWRGRLAGAPARLELPTDRPRPAVQSFRGALADFRLSGHLASALRLLGETSSATPFMVFLTAYLELLGRLSGRRDLVVGTPVANRDHRELEELVGFFVNTVVVRAELDERAELGAALGRVRETALDALAHQDLPFERLVDALGLERDLSYNPIFQVLFTLQNAPGRIVPLGGVELVPLELELGGARFDLALSLAPEDDGGWYGVWEYAAELFDRPTLERWSRAFVALLEGFAAGEAKKLGEVASLASAGRHQLVVEWNDTAEGLGEAELLHSAFERRAAREGDAVVLVCGREALSAAELDRRAEGFAAELARRGVGPGAIVGVSLPRSLELVVALLGILKAGAAYLPLDPDYPVERLEMMREDSRAALVIADPAEVRAAAAPAGRTPRISAGGRAYVIYTSGSTGRPKGVEISHRNVVNFGLGMDRALAPSLPGPGFEATWLAVTSVSFDISVLELLWTLGRGFRVAIAGAAEPDEPAEEKTFGARGRTMDFSLFYFASDSGASDSGGQGQNRYRLLLEGARFADRNDFEAIWTPERHFHAFGGLYPNPAVTGAAVAAATERVGIRAGSVVLPLHDPVRVAEEWSVVDNLSNGRVAVSIASGWHADDFVLAPERYEERREILVRDLETIQELWRGGSLTRTGGAGRPVEVRIHPPPVQAELPIWYTAAGNPKSFELAGSLGANILTHLLGQSVEALAEKIAIYRRARRAAGHDDGRVTLMLHTFVGDELERVREEVRGPFREYLRSSTGLLANLARGLGQDLGSIQDRPEDLEALLDHAFERYFRADALMGTPESLAGTVEGLRGIGVDEAACLIDFGVETDSALAGLEALDALRRQSQRRHPSRDQSRRDPRHRRARIGEGLGRELLRHRATHLQATPSLATVLLADPEAVAGLERLEALCLGGEALPPALAERWRELSNAPLYNLYGPTETTIWSTAERLDPAAARISIGRPIANTSIHVVGSSGRLVPIGVEGELTIGGRGLARGYLRRPSLTAERFVPDPFCPSRGARLYRTGDRVRRRPDGRLDHLGRLDHQVKILGHRIEPGEIEAVLRAHPGVREAAVVMRKDAAGPRLVGYVVGTGTAARKEIQPRLGEVERDRLLAGRERFRLPNGMEVAQFDARQAMELYREVFDDTAYERHGVRFDDGGVIFDVGANTGFFTLFACQQCTPSRVFAFEPLPPNHEILAINAALYGDEVKTFNCGLASEPGTAEFTFFPNITGLSSRFTDVEEERQAVAAIARGFESQGAFEGLGQDELQAALDEHLRTESFECELRTLSQVIRDEGVERIDLLKIDVERSEVEVLEGIEDGDWPKIRQIVLEVHSDDLLAATRGILEERGFEVAVEDFLHFDGDDGSGLRVYLVYALGPGAAAERSAEPIREAAPTPDAAALRAWVGERLPAYMVPAAFVELPVLPRTPNGKVDRAALPEPGSAARAARVAYVEPRGETERLVAEVWREVLGVEKVGAKDNFFEAGGTSLSLVQVSRQLEENLGRPVPLVEMFRHPTVDAMAEFLTSSNGSGAAVSVEEGRVRAERRSEAMRESSELERQRQFMANRPRRGRRRGGPTGRARS